MKYLIMAFLLLATTLQATQIGVIKKIEGKAKVQHQKSLKKKSLKPNQLLQTGDTILTYKDSKVVVELVDKTKIVLDSYSKLKLVSLNEYEQNGGKIFFKVTKRKGKKGLKVKTPFAIIGVKGTEFLVTDTKKAQGLALNEGLVGVDSPTGKKFEHIDGDKIKEKMQSSSNNKGDEYDAYKAELLKEFSEFTSSFDLKPGKKLRFKNGKVLETSQNSTDHQVFKLYMSDAEFKAISKELEKDVEFGTKGSDNAFDSDFFSDEL